MAPIKILVFTTGLNTGGAERMLVKLVGGLTRQSCRFAVVSLLDAGTQGGILRELGATVEELNVGRLSNFLGLPYRLRKVVRQHDPEVIQGWMYHGNVAAALGRGLARSRARLFWGVRQTFYGMSMERPLTRLVIRANATLSNVPDSVIFNSRLSLEQHCAMGFSAEKSVVIPNGFDTALFRADAGAGVDFRQRLALPQGAEVVGLVARDHPMKDHANFLRAAAIVARERPDVYFVLAGRGVDSNNSRVTSLVSETGLSARVRLLGEFDETQRLYPALDVAVLSSAWGEAFPNVLGEAMACGVPCVSTDVGDAREIVGEAGRIVPRADSESLAAAILDVLRSGTNERRRLGERARHRVEELYSIAAVARQYLDLYSSARDMTGR